MSIKKKLQLSVVITILVVFVIAGALLISHFKTDQLTEKTKTSQKIMKEIFESNALTQDYFLYPGERAQIQWYAKHKKIQELLQDTAWSYGGDSAQLETLRKEHARLKTIFDEISIHSSGSDLGRDLNIVSEVGGRLVDQFRISSQTMVSIASALANNGLTRRSDIQDVFDMFIFGILLVSLISLIVGTILIYRSIELPLAQLHYGTDLLASGDLDYKLDSNREDEFGQIAQSFNEMTRKLKKTHDDLTLSKKNLEERVEELEKFNKVVVSRELKMIELKKEIETLREKGKHV